MAATEMSAEQRERELNEARSEKEGYENDIWYMEREYDRNSQKISRLKSVRSNLEVQKANADDRYKSLKEYAGSSDNFGDWYGAMYTKVKENLDSSVVSEYARYVERIDEVLDAVCNEITRLQNKNMQLNGDILYLGSLVNSLINKIRTLCN